MAERYVSWEDETILEELRDINRRNHWEVMKRCQEISDEYLPWRSADGIKARWFTLIGPPRDPQFTPPIRDLDELVEQLSAPTRARIKVRLPGIPRQYRAPDRK